MSLKPPEAILQEITAQVDAGIGDAVSYLADIIRNVIGEQAVLVAASGRRFRFRARYRAKPGAPPRRVSGNLQSHVDVRHPEPGVWEFGVWGVPYAAILEDRMGHPFMEPTIERELGEMGARVGLSLQAERVV